MGTTGAVGEREDDDRTTTAAPWKAGGWQPAGTTGGVGGREDDNRTTRERQRRHRGRRAGGSRRGTQEGSAGGRTTKVYSRTKCCFLRALPSTCYNLYGENFIKFMIEIDCCQISSALKYGFIQISVIVFEYSTLGWHERDVSQRTTCRSATATKAEIKNVLINKVLDQRR